MGEHAAPEAVILDLHVRHLESDIDDKREIHKIPIIGFYPKRAS
jgi:hypothetical protein